MLCRVVWYTITDFRRNVLYSSSGLCNEVQLLQNQGKFRKVTRLIILNPILRVDARF